MIDRPRGVHLCGNPDWEFLLRINLDILSLDVYANSEVFVSYAKSIKKFLDRGGILVWGVVPTNFEPFEKETITSLISRLQEIWSALDKKGIDQDYLLSRNLLSPAACCLVNPDGQKTVERAFAVARELSEMLRSNCRLT